MYISGNFVAGVRGLRPWAIAVGTMLVGLLFCLFSCGVSVAAEQVWLENDTLVLEGVGKTYRIDGVPEGLTAKQAYQLVVGMVESVELNSEWVISDISTIFPVDAFVAKVATVVTYADGNWTIIDTIVSAFDLRWYWPSWVITALIISFPVLAGWYVAGNSYYTVSGRGHFSRELWQLYILMGIAVLSGLATVTLSSSILLSIFAVAFFGLYTTWNWPMSYSMSPIWTAGGPVLCMIVTWFLFQNGSGKVWIQYTGTVTGALLLPLIIVTFSNWRQKRISPD